MMIIKYHFRLMGGVCSSRPTSGACSEKPLGAGDQILPRLTSDQKPPSYESTAEVPFIVALPPVGKGVHIEALDANPVTLWAQRMRVGEQVIDVPLCRATKNCSCGGKLPLPMGFLRSGEICFTAPHLCPLQIYRHMSARSDTAGQAKADPCCYFCKKRSMLPLTLVEYAESSCPQILIMCSACLRARY